MVELDYDEILIEYAEKQEITDEILDQFDDLVKIHMLKERIDVILMRFSKSGLYTHIAYDPHAGVYVFIRCDGTRTALSPYGLDRLFRPSLERPQPPALLPAS